jgi:hypothetical protein
MKKMILQLHLIIFSSDQELTALFSFCPAISTYIAPTPSAYKVSHFKLTSYGGLFTSTPMA